jgi:16S rRNA A1518/A1519 N6-dimethyltransferase RsmA/KsgA/DIM1 with predicted DNA glycosylase/AP lyase activity
VRLARRGPVPGEALRRLVGGGFAHRRKALAGSLALAEPEVNRDGVRAALAAAGLPEDARAESLGPEDFRRLAANLGEAR